MNWWQSSGRDVEFLVLDEADRMSDMGSRKSSIKLSVRCLRAAPDHALFSNDASRSRIVMSQDFKVASPHFHRETAAGFLGKRVSPLALDD
jgi:superfamily II DNA/RNA helicase